MLRQVTREADQVVGQPHRLAQGGVVRVEPGLADVRVGQAVAPAPPHRPRQGPGHVLRQAQHLADLADGAARAVVDHGGADGGAATAVALVDVLDHLLAPLVLEIHVDVGRLVAVAGDETGEQEVDLHRVDRGHPQAVADHAVGRRTASLAQDVLGLGEAHHVVHGQEVAGVVLVADEGELRLQHADDLLRHAAGVAPLRPLPDQVLQVLLGALAGRDRLVRIFVAELVEAETAARGQPLGLGDRLRILLEQARHLFGRLEMALGVGLQPRPGFGQGDVLADAAHHVLQRAALGRVVEHVVGGQQLRARRLGDLRQPVQPSRVGRAVPPPHGEPYPPRSGRAEAMEGGFKPGRSAPSGGGIGHDRQAQALGVGDQVVEGQAAVALPAPLAGGPEGDQPRQPGVALAVLGIGQHLGTPVGEGEAGAHHQAKAEILGRRVGAHDAGQGVAVGHGDGGVAERLGRLHQLPRARGAAQEGEAGRDRQLGIGRAHGSRPCMYQRGAGASP